MADTNILNRILPDNYIYISHLDDDLKFWRLPEYPDQISDSMESTFNSTTALGRTAPVYTYSHSGPRNVQINITLHRDMMDMANEGYSNYGTKAQGYGEDYVDNLINALRSIAVPKYNVETNKFLEPPLVALRLGREVFVKGVVIGSIGVSFGKPILSNERYAYVTLALTIAEVDPYDSETVYKNGGFRGMMKTFREGAANIGVTD